MKIFGQKRRKEPIFWVVVDGSAYADRTLVKIWKTDQRWFRSFS